MGWLERDFFNKTGKIRCIACDHGRRCGATYKTPATAKNTQLGKIPLVACDQRQLSCVAGEIATRRLKKTRPAKYAALPVITGEDTVPHTKHRQPPKTPNWAKFPSLPVIKGKSCVDRGKYHEQFKYPRPAKCAALPVSTGKITTDHTKHT
jgi:hypothetical protein